MKQSQKTSSAMEIESLAFEWVRGQIKNMSPEKTNSPRGLIHEIQIDFSSLNLQAATDDQAVAIVDAAMTDDASWDVAKGLIFVQLNKGIILHPILSKLAAIMLVSSERKRTSRRPKQYGRDVIIVALMMILETKFNITPTRNRASSTLSGADIVSICLNERNFNVTPEAVTKVWTNRRKE